MEDKILEKRKGFFNTVTDGKDKREKFMVDLRKKRKQQMFKNKRMIRMQEESNDNKEGQYYSEDGVLVVSKSKDTALNKYHEFLYKACPELYSDDLNLVS